MIGPGLASARSLVLYGGMLFSAALAFDSPSLYIVGAGLALLGVAAWAWIAAARWGAGIERIETPSAVVESEPFTLRYRTTGGWLPALTEVEDGPLAGRIRTAAGRRGSRREAWGMGRLEQRGMHELDPVRLVVGDSLGLTAGMVEGARRESLLVLPRLEPVLTPEGEAGPSAAELRRGAGEATEMRGQRPAADAEVDGIRAYQAGTPASRIYWPSVARGEEIQERRLASAGGAAPLVVLDASGDHQPEELEQAVRAAASLCLHLARDGGCELVTPGMRRRFVIDPGLSAWPRAHARLAMVRAGAAPVAAASLPRDTPLFWVSAASGPPPSRGWLVRPGRDPAREPAFEVAGCAGYAVGCLPGTISAPDRPTADRQAAISSRAEEG